MLFETLNKKVIQTTRCLNREERERIYCALAGEIVAGLGAGFAFKKIVEKVLETAPAKIFIFEETPVEKSPIINPHQLKQNKLSAAPESHELVVSKPKPIAFERIGYQGFSREQAFLDNLKELPIEKELARRRSLMSSNKTIEQWSQVSTPDLIQIHRSLMKTNRSYKNAFERSDRNNPKSDEHRLFMKQLTQYQVDNYRRLEVIEDHTYQAITEALSSAGLQPKDFLKPVNISNLSEQFSDLYRNSPTFKIWYLSQRGLPPLSANSKASGVGDPFTYHAEFALKEWDKEIKRRLQPKNEAFIGYQMVNPKIESVGHIAYFGNKKFVSTPDGRYWISTGTSEVEAIPRWNGKPFEKQIFLDEQEKLKQASYQAKILKQYRQPKQAADGFEIPISNPNTIPGFNSGVLIQEGERRVMTDVGYAQPMVARFINARAWGYHELPMDRLGKIIESGWVENAPSSKLVNLPKSSVNSREKSNATGMHMTTLIGGYSLKENGGPAVSALVRTPLTPFRTKYAAPDVADPNRVLGDQLFFGHVTNDSIAAENLLYRMEFSVDGGLTWFPMSKDFVNLAEQGKLPNMRTQIIPRSR